MKKRRCIGALALVAALLAGLLAGCGKNTAPQESAPQSAVGITGGTWEYSLPPLDAGQPGSTATQTGTAQTGTAQNTLPPATTLPPAATGKHYDSPNKIPIKSKGKDYSGNTIPKGVAEIYAMDGRLLFTHVTRWASDKKTQKTVDFYTLYEYNPQDGTCAALSEEVGYITTAGGRFLYDKTGVPIGTKGFWDVPYFTNNGSWSNEKEITGAQAAQLLAAPRQAVIHGKRQPYTTQRNGSNIIVTLPETGEALPVILDPKKIFGSNAPEGFNVDVRGVANENLYISFSCTPKKDMYIKELISIPLNGGAMTPVRYGNYPVWIDPVSEIENGFLYGISVTPEGTVLLKIDSAANQAIALATVNKAVWHFVATDAYVLYEIPAEKPGAPISIGSKAIAPKGTLE
ncbi:MAG: hypothetical protein LBB50_00195 [Oscillospiraceae bacterium]|jgi:hypothetical protein|nr:hypothetical protein [Oscillospiraceae bacterium]